LKKEFIRRKPQPRPEPADKAPAPKVWQAAPPAQASSEEEALERIASAAIGPGGYRHFGDIPAHRLGRRLRQELYQLANALDEGERQNLSPRLKHAATTVTAALAAGFGEGTFRAAVSRALESRGALYAIQDHLDQLQEGGALAEDAANRLKEQVDQVIKAVNDYLGELAREKNRLSAAGQV